LSASDFRYFAGRANADADSGCDSLNSILRWVEITSSWKFFPAEKANGNSGFPPDSGTYLLI